MPKTYESALGVCFLVAAFMALFVAGCHQQLHDLRVLEKKETFTSDGEPVYWIHLSNYEDAIRINYHQFNRLKIGDAVDLKAGCGASQVVLKPRVQIHQENLTQEEREWLREAVKRGE